MDTNFVEVIGSLIIIVLGIALAAFISGTILWAIWPTAIPAAFPGLVASGALAESLTWWQSVCLAWIFAILFKSNSKAKDNK